MGVRAAVVSMDRVALASLWEVSTSPTRRDDCSDVEASMEMDVATGARNFYGRLWRFGRWFCGLVVLAGSGCCSHGWSH